MSIASLIIQQCGRTSDNNFKGLVAGLTQISKCRGVCGLVICVVSYQSYDIDMFHLSMPNLPDSAQCLEERPYNAKAIYQTRNFIKVLSYWSQRDGAISTISGDNATTDSVYFHLPKPFGATRVLPKLIDFRDSLGWLEDWLYPAWLMISRSSHKSQST
jgi:hypothetical protein